MAKHLILLLLSLNLSLALAVDPALTITEDFTNTSLKEAFVLLKDKYQLKIAYSERLVKDVNINLKVKDLGIIETFEKLLEEASLTFEYISPDAIIVKKDELKDASFDLIGEVVDAESGERLPFAYLFLEPIKKTVTSNEDGLFSLNNIRDESVLLTSYLGYQDTIINLGKGLRKQRLIINLKREPSTLEEVVVYDRNSQSFEPTESVNVVSLSPTFASQIPQAAEPDVFRTMQLLPGVNGTNELSSGLFINGGTANQNMVIFDGIPIYHVDHFFGYFSAINPYAIKSMRLFKGGFDAKYGGRSSSIVEFIGKDGHASKVGGNISFNLLSANSSLEVPVNANTTIFLSARRSYTDILSTSLFEKIFSLYEKQLNDEEQEGVMIKDQKLTPEFYYTDLNFKISTKLGLRNNLSFSFYDSNDILNYDEDYTATIKADTTVDVKNVGFVNWGNIGASLKWATLWNGNHYSNFLASYSHYGSTYSELSAQNIRTNNGTTATNTNTNQDNFIKDISIKADHEWTIGVNRLEFGAASSLYQTRINSTLDDSVITYKNQQQIWLHTQYIQNHFQPTQNTTISIGLRNNYLSSNKSLYLEPRLSFTQNIGTNVTWSGALGVYRQFVNQINTENALEGSRDLWVVSDHQVPDQKAIHAMTGISRTKKGLLISVNLFHKNFDGIMDYAFREGGLITEYEDYEDLFFEGEGVAQGLEFLIKKEGRTFNTWASYTLSKVKYKFPDLNQGKAFLADHDQRHELNLFGSYRVGQFEIFSTWFFGSGKPYSELILENSPMPPDPRRRENRVTFLKQSEKNNLRLPKYHRLDLGVNYHLNLGKSALKFTASVFNLYNRSNVYDRKLEIIEAPRRTDMRRGAPLSAIPYDVKLMGITPSLSAQFSF
ncbi:MAG: TonB-dependent receptor [Cyclobacteriaceae bacterium]